MTTLPASLGGTDVTELPLNGNGHSNGNGHGAGSRHERPRILSAREVEVIRRLYRSGESEYLIDGQLCRLRDVHELLMDTGLGAKAYAIIEQGKIGLILSSRPADRRQLIEEAAGITKYKSRRRAAELKLEAAQQNLTRIDDIVFEVEKQRGTLKRQAAKARRFQKLRDEMRRWEKVLFAGRYRELGVSIESARARLADARAREAAAAGRVAEMEATLGRLRIEVAEADARADARPRRGARARARGAAAAPAGGARQAAGREPRDPHGGDGRGDRRCSRRGANQAGGALQRRTRRPRRSRSSRDASETARRGAGGLPGRGSRAGGLEHDLESARSAVYNAVTASPPFATPSNSAASGPERVAEVLGRLDVEDDDLAIEREGLAAVADRGG